MSDAIGSVVEVRYEEHLGGGSVWVWVQNRLDYADEWLCVWSTDPRNRDLRASVQDQGFLARTVSGPSIPVPHSAGKAAHAEASPVTSADRAETQND